MNEETELAHIHVKNHKETALHDPHNNGILLENDHRTSAERLLLKKLDHRLLPTIVVIYIMNFIDVRQPLGSTVCLLMDLDLAISRDICQAERT